MAQRHPLRFSQAGRPLWLLLAFASAILVGLTSPGAHARPVVVLLQSLARDLGALRVQLEQVAVRPSEHAASGIAFEADVGDGGPGFHRDAMAATLRTAHRSAALLAERYHEAGDGERLEAVQRMVLRLYEMEGWLFAMRRAPDALALRHAWHGTEATLHDLDRMMAGLRSGRPVAGAAAPPSAPIGATGTSPAAAVARSVLRGGISPL